MEEQTVTKSPQTQHPEKPKMKSRGSVSLAGLLLLAITLPILVVFVKQQVEIRSRAVGGGNIPTPVVSTNPCTGAQNGTACTDTCARACPPDVRICTTQCTTREGFCMNQRCETWLTPTPTRTPTPTPGPTNTPTPRPTSTLIPGDLTGDGRVDIYDYNIMLKDFGKTGSPGWIPADINKDGTVDIYDYNILIGNFGT